MHPWWIEIPVTIITCLIFAGIGYYGGNIAAVARTGKTATIGYLLESGLQ